MAWLVVSADRPLTGFELAMELLATKAVGLYPANGPFPTDTRPGWSYKEALVVATGMDRPGADGDLEAFLELVEAPWPTLPVSSTGESGLQELAERTYQTLNIIRIYTKEPRKEPDMDQPFTLKRGSTVGDLARAIHKDIAEGFKFARVWGPSAFDGQSVQDAHVLEEGDVVEIHW
jgi:ribosome-interacting GTPase 1